MRLERAGIVSAVVHQADSLQKRMKFKLGMVGVVVVNIRAAEAAPVFRPRGLGGGGNSQVPQPYWAKNAEFPRHWRRRPVRSVLVAADDAQTQMRIRLSAAQKTSNSLEILREVLPYTRFFFLSKPNGQRYGIPASVLNGNFVVAVGDDHLGTVSRDEEANLRNDCSNIQKILEEVQMVGVHVENDCDGRKSSETNCSICSFRE